MITRKQRLFVALWPSAQARGELAKLARRFHAQWGGRKVDERNLHITLAFLGDIEAERISEVCNAMENVARVAFDVELDAVEYRRDNRIVWARATKIPEPLAALVRHLREALRERDFVVEARKFVPHLTLLRDAHKPGHCDPPAPIHWRVNEMSLTRSELLPHGPRYAVIGRVPLAGG